MKRIAAWTLLLSCWFSVSSSADAADRNAQSIVALLKREAAAGNVVGAQVLSGSRNDSRSRCYSIGQISPSDRRPVTRKTLFCVASCSKPVASAVIFTLLDRRKLALSQPVDRLLPAFSDLKADGVAVRSPTVKELLAHRAGLYSQNKSPTAQQIKAIRDFRLSLAESVEMISQESLVSEPGAAYLYSGAGYCVLGRLAEVATGADWENVLQANLCEPAGMKSTTYFPTDGEYEEIAEGGGTQLTPPHRLGSSLKLPLIGGSLYTTAGDFDRFLRIVLNEGSLEGRTVLSKRAVEVLTGPAFDNQNYGHGWLLTKRNGKVIALGHKGSLPPYQAAIRVHLPSGTFRVVLWTLAKPANVQATIRIRDQISAMMQTN